MMTNLKVLKGEENSEFDLYIDGYVHLEYDDGRVMYLAKGAIENIYVSPKGVSFSTFNGNEYSGFKNSYDNIVDQMNFTAAEVEFEPCDCESDCEECSCGKG